MKYELHALKISLILINFFQVKKKKKKSQYLKVRKEAKMTEKHISSAVLKNACSKNPP